MITAPEPKEYARQKISVVSGAGSKAVNLSGYLDAMIIDAPASETYKISIKGPAGVEYYISPSNLTGDTTVFFSQAIPMTGSMTLGITGSSGDGVFYMTPVGNVK